MDRRKLFTLAGGAAGALALSGCAGAAAKLTTVEKTISTDVTKVVASIETTAGELITNWANAKGVALVAETALNLVASSNPIAAAALDVITKGISLIDGYIASGSAAVEANASTIAATTTSVINTALQYANVAANDAATVANTLATQAAATAN